MEESYDLVVIGGGLSGICAALAAARLGEKVCLVQDRPVLGGNSSSEIRVGIQGAMVGPGYWRHAWETGIISELVIEAWYRMPYRLHRRSMMMPLWDLILEEWLDDEPNATVYLNTRATEPVVAEDGRIVAVKAIQVSNERNYTFHAPWFIDASGDGTVAFRAGAAHRYGREARSEFDEISAPEVADDKVLPAAVQFWARDHGHPMPFRPPKWARKFPAEADLPFRKHSRLTSGYWWISLGGDKDMIDDIESIRKDDLAALLGVWDHLKNQGNHGADNYALDWISNIPGKRESRRFEGDYMLNQNDVNNRVLFPDRVAYGGRSLDLHPAEGINSAEAPCRNPMLKGLFSLPMRSLYSRNIPNLFFAGRNISVSHVALGATRVMATCALTGQAAGTAMHYCRRYGLTPRQLVPERMSEVQQQLVKDGCYIIEMPNTDPTDLARGATITASSNAPLPDVTRATWAPLDGRRGQLLPLTAGRLDSVTLELASALQRDWKIEATLHPASTVYDFSDETIVGRATATVPACGTGPVEFMFGCEIAPGLYWVEIGPAAGISWGMGGLEPLGTQAAVWWPHEVASPDEITFVGFDAADLPDFDNTPRWKMERGTYCAKVSPASFPYGASNVLSGVTRPERTTNLWMSDPNQPMPQWLDLDFGSEVEIASVQITFNVNLDIPEPEFPYQTGGTPEMPDCVRDYRVECQTAGNGEWHVVARGSGNYQQLVRHRFPAAMAKKLRLVVEATAGSPSAQVYEVRAYGPSKGERPEPTT
jgi:hypothetical protein